MSRPPHASAPASPAAAGELPTPSRAAAERGSGLFRLLLDGSRVGLLGVIAYGLLFNLSVVRGSSMTPGIHDGDRILVQPWSYALGEVERGDIVVLRYPLDPRVDYIKRVIGLPGDRVTMADGYLWVNGELLAEPYVQALDRRTYLSITVDEASYFVLGDNRPRSSDSREFGLVPAADVRGRVDLRLWPPSRVGWID